MTTFSESTMNRRLERSNSVVKYSATLSPLRDELDGFVMALGSNPRSVLNKEVVKSYSQRLKFHCLVQEM